MAHRPLCIVMRSAILRPRKANSRDAKISPCDGTSVHYGRPLNREAGGKKYPFVTCQKAVTQSCSTLWTPNPVIIARAEVGDGRNKDVVMCSRASLVGSLSDKSPRKTSKWQDSNISEEECAASCRYSLEKRVAREPKSRPQFLRGIVWSWH